ncbi:MAG: hypothetical protein IPN55_07625 [Saprospiraceae bacterium]|nr:hypothetical protein [Candidatus Brachybacter algidus]
MDKKIKSDARDKAKIDNKKAALKVKRRERKEMKRRTEEIGVYVSISKS